MADPGLRGFLTGSTLAFYCLGIVIIYALGATLAWNTVAFCGTILPVLALSALLMIPESPTWLVRRKKPEEARKALLWLRGGNAKQVPCIHIYACINKLINLTEINVSEKNVNTNNINLFELQVEVVVLPIYEKKVTKFP